jgi:hypothetical protein
MIGAGIVGLTMAREIKHRYPSQSVLNAFISKAFTSAFPFARHICDNYIEKR